jgi:hypothetical protein
VAHVGLVGLEVETFPAGVADDLAQLEIAVNLLFDATDFRLGVAGAVQFVGNIGIEARTRPAAAL